MADSFNAVTRPSVNVSATTDPTSSSDITQGYSAGSVWINTTNLREWTCISNAQGAAVWAFGGAAYSNGGVEPNNVQTQFGSAALGSNFGAFNEEGNLYRNCGNPIAGNTADTNDDILDGFVLPANCFDIANRQIALNFNGKFGSTGNNKKIRVWLNPTMTGQTISASGVISGGHVTSAGSGVMIYDSTAQTTNGGGWQVDVLVCKYGVNGSNTQYTIGSGIAGATHLGSSTPIFTQLAENASMNIVVTGSSSTTGAANDVVLNYSEANCMN